MQKIVWKENMGGKMREARMGGILEKEQEGGKIRGSGDIRNNVEKRDGRKELGRKTSLEVGKKGKSR